MIEGDGPMATLARSDMKTHYVHDPLIIEALDIGQVVADLVDGSPANHPPYWVGDAPLTAYDHVAFITERHTGQYLGILLGENLVLDDATTVLLLRSSFVAERARGQGGVRRMLAHMLLYGIGHQRLPDIVAGRTSNLAFFQSLCRVVAGVAGAVTYPGPEAGPVNLMAVRAARRIADRVGRGVRFEAGTGVLRGGRVAGGGYGHSLVVSEDPVIDGVVGRTLEERDQILAVIDLRGADQDALESQARDIYLPN
jgi:hypothetical protein